jgi:hypothetical protein
MSKLKDPVLSMKIVAQLPLRCPWFCEIIKPYRPASSREGAKVRQEGVVHEDETAQSEHTLSAAIRSRDERYGIVIEPRSPEAHKPAGTRNQWRNTSVLRSKFIEFRSIGRAQIRIGSLIVPAAESWF